MANINEILARAAALRDETALNSIDPERAGGIMYDTLIALNELWLQTGSALVISKIYSSVAAMNADTNPVSDLTGQPLKPGQIVVISSSDSDNGTVYRYNGTSSPRWSVCGTIGGVAPVDNLNSDSSALPLAARQGKVLDGKISQLDTIEIISDGIGGIYEEIYSENVPITDYISVELTLGEDVGTLYIDLATGPSGTYITTSIFSGAKTEGRYSWKVPYNGEKYIRFFNAGNGSYPSNSSFRIAFPEVKETLWADNSENKDDIAGLKDDVAAFNKEWVDVTSSYPMRTDLAGTSHCLINSNGTIGNASSGGVSDLYDVELFRDSQISTTTNAYNRGIAYYDKDGLFIGQQCANGTFSDTPIVIPAYAKKLRFSSSNNAGYTIKKYRIITEKEIADLQDAVEEAGIYDAANAVTYKEKNKIYVKSNIISANDATFDSNFWAVSGGNISFLGGSNATPFEFSAATQNGKSYLIKAVFTAHAYENCLKFQIGNGYPADPYNGTGNVFASCISDGGKLKILPLSSSNTFTISSITCQEVSDDSDYIEIVELGTMNVDNGNMRNTLVDGKWCVAIGPTDYTMSSNVGGSRSVAIGYQALKLWKHGMQNIAIGTFAAPNLISGERNIAIGCDTLYQLSQATDCVAIGHNNFGKPTLSTARQCIAIGQNALGNNQSDVQNTVAIGCKAGYNGGNSNVYIGDMSGYGNTGVANVMVGELSGYVSGGHHHCTLLGRYTGFSGNGTYEYSTALGHGATITKSNQVVIGTASVEEVVIAGKKIMFNNDNTVSWETIS